MSAALHALLVAGVSIMEFQKRDVVRHQLVQRIIQAYEEHREIKDEGARNPKRPARTPDQQ